MAETTGRTCGEATMRLLAEYGIDTVFGIPGVHTLEFCRGLAGSPIRHVQARNEQGAGFMADGYARSTGKVGVALVISGPGVTNALTPLGQSWADSVPVLLLSSETASYTHGLGLGALHEIPDQMAVTAPLTGLSARATHAEEVPELLQRAFECLTSGRPRPVHISIPIDVLGQTVTRDWFRSNGEIANEVRPDEVETGRTLLANAKRPMIMVGGGATGAATHIRNLSDQLSAPVLCSTAGKGIVADDSPLSLSASTVRAEARQYLSTADVVLAVGTELAETDSFVEELDLPGELVRVDIDPRKLDDQYLPTVSILGDARVVLSSLVADGPFESARPRETVADEVAQIRAEILQNLTPAEAQHVVLLRALRDLLPEDVYVAGDICQLVYTGAFAFDVSEPRSWSYPAGYCTLGCGLPNAIGAQLAKPDRPVICLAGDGGFMFTPGELIVASEEQLPIPIIVWDNGGLKQIQDDMDARNIVRVGVEGANPDFVTLARSMHCDGVVIEDLDHFVQEVPAAFSKDRPTVLVVREGDGWLRG